MGLVWTTFAAAAAFPPLALALAALAAMFFERKLIGLAQKRLGPTMLGRNGWAHLLADVVKFWAKQAGRHTPGWGGGPAGPLAALAAYLTWTLAGCAFFSSDAGAAAADFWDFQLVAYVGYAGLTTLLMQGLVLGLKSKYATLAAARLTLVTAALEVFFAATLLAVYAHTGAYSLPGAAAGWTAAASPAAGALLGLYALFEAKRAPFDHTEAESELVAGHLVEFGGRGLLAFLLAEYAHVFFCVFVVLALVLGGTAPLPLGWAWAPTPA